LVFYFFLLFSTRFCRWNTFCLGERKRFRPPTPSCSHCFSSTMGSFSGRLSNVLTFRDSDRSDFPLRPKVFLVTSNLFLFPRRIAFFPSARSRNPKGKTLVVFPEIFICAVSIFLPSFFFLVGFPFSIISLVCHSFRSFLPPFFWEGPSRANTGGNIPPQF